MPILWCDFETKSRCDLRARGVYNYCMDASTSVLCMSYAFDDEDVVTWTPDQPFPRRVAEHTGQIRAHNAAFERLHKRAPIARLGRLRTWGVSLARR
jgi:hypothetical protein